MEHPIERIKWVPADDLRANDYNPNVVYSPELDLLAFSILKSGWIQPILVTADFEIIDGFHRVLLARSNAKVREITGGRVPVVIMDLSEPERILLTIRINRAKGHHIAFRMSEAIKTLVETYGLPLTQICKEIGATKDEIDLLLMDDVFQKFDVDNREYSKAWVPKGGALI